VNHLARRYAAAIADRQGGAPCVVAGHSYGGVVAQEVSRRLVAQGVPVERCILLDTSVPRRRLVAGRRRRARALGDQGVAMTTMKEVLYALHAAAGISPAPHRLTTERMIAALWGMSWHRIRTTPVPLLVVRAADHPTYHDLADWGAHTSGGCTVVDAPGDHNGMLGPPYVDHLASLLAEQLDERAVSV
jgi:thioesterase domain-containing protein